MSTSPSGLDTSVTVIIPAYNEEANIARIVCQVLNEPWAVGQLLESIVVVDDCSSDHTHEIAQSLACSDQRVHVVRHEQRSGKNTGIRLAAVACTSNVLVVVDADVLLTSGCLVKTIALLSRDPSLMATSCIVEPLPAQSWAERASRSQALFVSELKRRGQAYLSALYAIRAPAFGALDVPDGVADDAYVTCWLRGHGYPYAVRRDAKAYIRAAVGLRDFAKQTLRGRRGEQATKRAVPEAESGVYKTRCILILGALWGAFVRDPLGFFLYAAWYAIVLATPTATWLPNVSLSTFDSVRSTKDLGAPAVSNRDAC